MKTFLILLSISVNISSCRTPANTEISFPSTQLQVHFNDGSIDTLIVRERFRLAFECLEEKPQLGDEFYCVARNVKYVKRIFE